MNVCILGSEGFIGSNLYLSLTDDKRAKEIFKITSSSSIDDLSKAINDSDVIVHLAGVNRSDNESDFFEVNVNFTKIVVEKFCNSKKAKKLIFSSSKHAGRNDAYGKTKIDAEKILEKANKNSDKEISILRLPGIFGKNCKPNYNSVVATFCHRVANDLDLDIHDPDKEIEIAYIDDLIKLINYYIFDGGREKELTPIYSIKLKDLANDITVIANKDNFIPDLNNNFLKKLHATFLYYKKPEDIVTKLKVNEDKRGAFAEIVKTKSGGQFSYVTAHPGETRGIHYHHTKTEKFLVVYGKAKFRQKNMFNGNIIECILDHNDPKTVDSIPGYVHSIENIGDGMLIAVIWCNEIFNKDKPDTFQRKKL